MAVTRGKSPQPPALNNSVAKGKTANSTPPANSTSYKSDGVEDNDVFMLPASDYLALLGVTVLSTIVRVFRIYQPTSVVFDEVQ